MDASGVGSTSSGSLSLLEDDDDGDGPGCRVLTEALRSTCLSGEDPKPSRDGVLKLKVLSGIDS